MYHCIVHAKYKLVNVVKGCINYTETQAYTVVIAPQDISLTHTVVPIGSYNISMVVPLAQLPV